MKILLQTPFINQRMLAEASGHSLGVVNRSVKELVAQGYLDEQLWPTSRAKKEFQERSPKRAIHPAAGFGMRMVPINTEVPKGLLEVNKEPLIERQIRQLHEVGIREIYVVVGFMKERYEYLIDEFGVELVVNPDYMTKNNLHSVSLVRRHLENAYIIPCDIWCDRNPFDRYESYSWYMVSDLVENEVLSASTGKWNWSRFRKEWWQCNDRNLLSDRGRSRYRCRKYRKAEQGSAI